jgi:hypothetical protein
VPGDDFGLTTRRPRECRCIQGCWSFRCTHPGTNRGFRKHNYLARLFLARRLRAFAGNLRFGPLFPRFFLPLVFDFLDLLDLLDLVDLVDLGVRAAGSEVPCCRRNARSAVDESGDLRPCRKAHTGAFRSGREEAACSGMRA